jgi:cytochrome P450
MGRVDIKTTCRRAEAKRHQTSEANSKSDVGRWNLTTSKAHACSELKIPEFNWTFADTPERRSQLNQLASDSWIARGTYGFIFFRYEDCSAILRDSRWFNSASMASEMMAGGKLPNYSLTSMEGSEHSRLKRLVSPFFGPRSAEDLRSYMADLISDQLIKSTTFGCVDLISDIFDSFPIRVIARLLGVPDEDWGLFSKWSEDILLIYKENAIEHVKTLFNSALEMQSYVEDLIRLRRINPGDDLVSSLVAASDEQGKLDEKEIVFLIQSIIVGGTDTTRNQIGLAVATLLQHSQQWEKLVANPNLVDLATDEAIRFSSITSSLSRFASEDIIYKDVLFPRGTLASLSITSANRDKEMFELGDELDITKVRNRQNLTFGGGIHYCLAASLARVEIEEAIRSLVLNTPNIRLNGEIIWKDPLSGVFGPESIPVSFS